jgi:hypothetical protein
MRDLAQIDVSVNGATAMRGVEAPAEDRLRGCAVPKFVSPEYGQRWLRTWPCGDKRCG